MRLSARAWAPALVLGLCGLGLALAGLDPVDPAVRMQPPRVPEISEEGRQLLGGLEVGDQLVGWTVQSLDGPHDGVLRIDVGRDRVRFALMVAARERLPQSPPLSTERYAIYYGHAVPPEITLPDNTIRATTHALARRIRAHEATVEVPGM